MKPQLHEISSDAFALPIKCRAISCKIREDGEVYLKRPGKGDDEGGARGVDVGVVMMEVDLAFPMGCKASLTRRNNQVAKTHPPSTCRPSRSTHDRRRRMSKEAGSLDQQLRMKSLQSGVAFPWLLDPIYKGGSCVIAGKERMTVESSIIHRQHWTQMNNSFIHPHTSHPPTIFELEGRIIGRHIPNLFLAVHN